MLCHEEQFDVVLLARQRLIEQLKYLCKSFQAPSGLKIQEPRQDHAAGAAGFLCVAQQRAEGAIQHTRTRGGAPRLIALLR
jgi:hypothetical protein